VFDYSFERCINPKKLLNFFSSVADKTGKCMPILGPSTASPTMAAEIVCSADGSGTVRTSITPTSGVHAARTTTHAELAQTRKYGGLPGKAMAALGSASVPRSGGPGSASMSHSGAAAGAAAGRPNVHGSPACMAGLTNAATSIIQTKMPFSPSDSVFQTTFDATFQSPSLYEQNLGLAGNAKVAAREGVTKECMHTPRDSVWRDS
jgi:hypothetical protein